MYQMFELVSQKSGYTVYIRNSTVYTKKLLDIGRTAQLEGACDVFDTDFQTPP